MKKICPPFSFNRYCRVKKTKIFLRPGSEIWISWHNFECSRLHALINYSLSHSFFASKLLLKNTSSYICRGWCPKFATGLNIIIIAIVQKVCEWSSCPFSKLISYIGESFWQNNRLVTHILFELWLIMIFSPVANFGQHPLQVKVNRQ